MVWNKLSELSRYYLVSLINLVVCTGILFLLQVAFINVIFFITAFVWHFALLTPHLKDKVMTNNHKFSFISVVVRINYYLQLFINLKRLPFGSSFVRALSPLAFSFLLLVLGGAGNLLFTLLGSFCFEVIYLLTYKKFNHSISSSDLDSPPAIPTEEKLHE